MSSLNTKNSSDKAGNLSELVVLLNETSYFLWLTVPPVLLVLGCFGNVMTIVVMRAMRASESTACLSVYFTALALSDLCLVVTSVATYWPQMAFEVSLIHLYDPVCVLSFFLFYLTSMTSAWFLMAMTCQRMMSVIVPHRVGVLCTVERAKIVTVTLTVIACGTCVQIFFNYRVQNVSETSMTCQNIDEIMADIFFLIILIFSSILPFLFLIIANTILIKAVITSVKMSRSILSRPNQEQASSPRSAAVVSSITITLILTSVAFLVLTIPICISDFYMEEVGFYRGWVKEEETKAKLALMESVALLAWMSNSSVNFYIYVLSGRKFRQETARYLCLPFKQKGIVLTNAP